MKPPFTVPRAPRSLPLLGHAVPLLHDPLAFLTVLPACGDLVRIRIGPLSAVVVCDPELTRQVLQDDGVFDKGGPIYDRTREVTGDGLGECPHNRHRRLRRLVQPAFHRARLPGYARVMTAGADAMTRGWHEGQVLDVTREMTTLTLKVLLDTVLSSTFPPHAFSQAADDFSAVLGGIVRRAVTPPVLDRMPTPGNRRYHQAHNRLRHAVNGIITDHRAGNTDHGDVLSALMPARGPAEGGAVAELTDTEISDNVINFLIAGSDTTARTLAWSLYLVAQHSSIEERLHAEADTVLAGAPASFKHLSRLRFCGFVVTEALRLYPPAWLITRTVTSDTRLGGHDLPAGTTLVYSPYLLHRRGDLHPDPDRFDPDRWDSSHRPAPPRDAFVPFGNGARKCIGDQFALTQATITLATISARWRLEALTGPPIRATGGLLLKPKGLQMRVTARPFAPTPPEPEHDLPVSTPPPTPYEGRRTLPAETGETRTTG